MVYGTSKRALLSERKKPHHTRQVHSKRTIGEEAEEEIRNGKEKRSGQQKTGQKAKPLRVKQNARQAVSGRMNTFGIAMGSPCI